MIQFDDIIRILKAQKYDSWGISVVSDIPEYVDCKIFYALNQEELKNAKGELVSVTAKVYFDGLYPISFDDKLSFTDDLGNEHTLEILNIKVIKTLDNVVMYTKVSV